MKKRSFTSDILKIALTTGLLVFGACGDDNDGDVSLNLDDPNNRSDEEEDNQGTFEAPDMTVINKNKVTTVVNLEINSKFVVKQDNLVINVNFDKGPKQTKHKQFIHKGARCPIASDDTNGDGYIDWEETQAVVEGAIVPLDSDVDQQEAGENSFPTSNAAGSYIYAQNASLSQMLEDLRAPDDNPDDDIEKIPTDEQFSFVGRPIVIYGVEEETELPDSVVGADGESPQSCLPISCGLIESTDEQEDSGGTSSGATAGGTAGGAAVGGSGGGSTGGGSTGGATDGASSGGSDGASSGGSDGASSGGSDGASSGGTDGASSGGSDGSTGGGTDGASSGGSDGGIIGGVIGGIIGGSDGGSSGGE